MSNNSIIKRLFLPPNPRHFFFFITVDALLLSISLYFSFLLRFEFALDELYSRLMLNALPFFVLIKLTAFWIFGVYRFTWRFVGLRDSYNIIKALFISCLLLMPLILTSSHYPLPFLNPLLSFEGFPRSIFIIDLILSLIFILTLRSSKRFYLEMFHGNMRNDKGARTIIVGAGNTGEMILRDMLRTKTPGFYPIGFLDDNRKKIGTYIHRLRVLGPASKLRGAVRKYKADAIIIAIPSLNYSTLRNIYNAAIASKVNTIKIVPRIYDFQKPDINLKSLEDISIEDLLGRQAIKINYDEIGSLLKDKIILVTGGGGSIGSEIVVQVYAFQPRKLILFDMDETALHNMSIKLKKVFPSLEQDTHFIVGDIRDKSRVQEVFREFSPQIVFHAAAYKHVPMMEYNPKEAVKVNIFGTFNMARAAVSCNIEKFILISTDKAVRPNSIMGATKRVAEYVCKAFNHYELHPDTKFVSVRFGNVLGSRGSVLPLFMEQLKEGGPVTVTHKDMKRYFMTIPEAVSLVLEAAVIGRGGETLVLDMGNPVSIVCLAEDLIRVHGLEPYEDIDIEFAGIRPGEKLFEEILTAEEGTAATKHERVFVARNTEKYTMEEIEVILERFNKALEEFPIGDEQGIKDLLKEYVRHFSEENRKHPLKIQ
jgi:FlaA1/EpsC-like NDP-sugar epimerase